MVPYPLTPGWARLTEGTGRRFENGKRYKPWYVFPHSFTAWAVTVTFHDNSSCRSGDSPWLQISPGSHNIISFPSQAASFDISLKLPQHSSLFLNVVQTLKEVISLKYLVPLLTGTLKYIGYVLVPFLLF